MWLWMVAYTIDPILILSIGQGPLNQTYMYMYIEFLYCSTAVSQDVNVLEIVSYNA